MFIVADLVSLGDHSKIDKTKIFTTNCSLMKVECIAECAILLTCIKLYSVLKTNILSFWEWPFWTGFIVLTTDFYWYSPPYILWLLSTRFRSYELYTCILYGIALLFIKKYVLNLIKSDFLKIGLK